MHECLKKEFTGDDTSKEEFYQAFTLFFKENLCTGEFNEEIYIRDMEQLRKNFPTYEFLKDSKF